VTDVRIAFDWDPAKAAGNLQKHGVAFEDAMAVFSDPLALSRLDDPSAYEMRWVTIGMAIDRLLLVVHTYVEIDEEVVYVRMISARRPTKREKRSYEQAPEQD
jgi:hypothetical protein